MKTHILHPSIYLLAMFLIISFNSCKKAIEIGAPPNVLTPEKVFDSDASAIAATLGDYTSLSLYDGNFVAYADQYTDELSQTTLTATTTEFANSSLTVTNGAVATIWQNLYVTIYKANANLSQLAQTTLLTDSVKKQCTGEALFIRAYCYLNLVNIFGDVPLITSTDVSITSTAPRSPVVQINSLIVADLIQASTLLSVNYPTAEKIRPNKFAAQALLARAYLYQQDWQQAETLASTVINSGSYPLSPLGSAFYKNSNEAIWQLWNTNGFSALGAVLAPPPSGKPSYVISNDLLSKFEPGDQRKVNWTKSVLVSGVTYVAPYKYKARAITTGSTAEYTMYLRSAEQYLIRAEARAQQNNLVGATSDLNIIRTRAGLPNLNPLLTQQQVLAAIAQERRIELFAEGGHRFFDLKRTNQINSVMNALKPTWNTTKSPLFPIPQTQILINSSLTQNPGY